MFVHTYRIQLITALLILAVLGLTSIIYWQGLHGPFLLDDMQNIVRVYVADFNWDELLYAATHNTSGMLGRPVSVLSLMFSGIVHGPESWGYKYHNLAVHLINGLLIFWLLLRLLPHLAAGAGRQKTQLVAGLVATIWVLHPLMVSTVLYAVQRMTQLSALFTLAALITYTFARQTSRDEAARFYLLAYLVLPFFTVLSLLSKENGALIPLYIFAIELIAYQFSFSSVKERNRTWGFLGVFVILPVVTGGLYILTHMDQFTNYDLRNFDMGERLMTQLHVVTFYLKMILLPRLSDMTLFHDYFPVTRSLDLFTVVLLLLYLLAFFLVFFWRKKAPVASFAIAWFIVSHLLESTFFSLELMFEHRNYLAAVGPILGVVYYLCSIPGYASLKYLNAAFLLLVVFLTINRVDEWGNEELLYQIAVTEHPDSSRAQTEMANFRFNNGNLNSALIHLAAAQENSPEDFGPVLHEVVYRCGTGTTDNMDSLMQQAKIRAENFPATAYGMNSLNNLLSFLVNDRCPEVSIDQYLSLLETAVAKQREVNSEQYLGFLENLEGQAYLARGDYAQGIGLVLSAYDRTGMPMLLGNLAENLLRLQLLNDAEHIIGLLENINNESHGIETALLVPLREKLAVARSETPRLNADEAESEGGPDGKG